MPEFTKKMHQDNARDEILKVFGFFYRASAEFKA